MQSSFWFFSESFFETGKTPPFLLVVKLKVDKRGKDRGESKRRNRTITDKNKRGSKKRRSHQDTTLNVWRKHNSGEKMEEDGAMWGGVLLVSD